MRLANPHSSPAPSLTARIASALSGMFLDRRPRGLPFPAILTVTNSRLVVPGPDGSITYAPGGLASAMVPTLQAFGPNLATAVTPLPRGERSTVGQLNGEPPFSFREVPLPKKIYAQHYRFANAVLWPWLHQMESRCSTATPDQWNSYRLVNLSLAGAAAGAARPDGLVEIHDYHLMLTPLEVRRRAPTQAIGYFHHVPFPALRTLKSFVSEVQAGDLIRGLLGSDLIGFHVEDYRRNFLQAVNTYVRDAEILSDTHVRWDGRIVTVGDFPIGIDVDGVRALYHSEEAKAAARDLRAHLPDGKIFLGVSRFDYTKALETRILAFGRLMRERPDLKGKVVLVQYAAPTRKEIPAYKEYRSYISSLVDAVNGKYRTDNWQPIHFYPDGLAYPRVMGAAAEADVVVVAPRADGMNLFIKEAVIANDEKLKEGGEPPVYLLSKYAGAARQLVDALLINGRRPSSIFEGYLEALSLIDRPAERIIRHHRLQAAVEELTVGEWRDLFLNAAAQAVRDRNRRGYLRRSVPLSA